MLNLNQLLEWNKQKAYSGKLGRDRELFCLEYVKQKSKIVKEVEDSQVKESDSIGLSITCKKKCQFSTCCMEYVDATIQECEVIVYYLYHHPEALSQFLKNYPMWKEKVSLNESISKEFDIIYQELSSKQNPTNQRILNELENRCFDLHIRYFDLHISCPFLLDNQCIIYDARPYACVGAYSTSPRDLCALRSDMLPPIKRSMLPDDTFYIPLFYYGKLDIPNPFFMVRNVYDILVSGYTHIAEMTGLVELGKEAKRQNLIHDI
jgi:Fe-S-cluster containining protein